ncbi:tetratricopeptide repeat protein [Hydrogenimonas thermophila]|uniref:tetratricopeptide repeat protein n=1 Tax=Hydrogenimonas thermophila TaxID=223786 RepID=UPI00293730AE|nr:tetratricopeptide repeat protein [Hydrogenimonas thermophila]WOE70587.1 tetratricopeptide repeat protein [Hydrogenimonas thermophila]WOE73105.1 tetratricopeptide repeat protein [Hydrogenimonas thermophila]
MAEEEEEVIIIEEDEPDESSKDDESLQNQDDEKKKKRLILIIIGAIILVLLILLLIFFIKNNNNESEIGKSTDELVSKIKTAEKKSIIKIKSQIETMIKKANILYARGNKKEALKLFEQIATYSESISNYNLGVAQMRKGRYKEAIDSFKKAIQNNENQCISALNAAVCSLHLKDKNLFSYYIQMAEAYLPDTYNSSLYSYLFALINYYKGNYYDILSAIKHPTTNSYAYEQNHIAAASYLILSYPLKAIDHIEKVVGPDDYLILGQMYARIGDYSLAANYLKKALTNSNYPLQSKKSLALVYLKNRMTSKAAKLLKELESDYKEKVNEVYPIQTKLSSAVTDVDAAQQKISLNELIKSPTSYKLIFEFAPFKVFNATQTLNYIKKGNAAIYVDEEEEATKYLSRSSSLSRANLMISKAIKYAIENRLLKANEIFNKALKHYPNHSILHYNLALTYAKLGNYTKAHEHFLRSYHLDSSNFLSGIFSLFCEALIHKHIPQVEKFLQEDLRKFIDPTTLQLFYQSLFYYYKGNITAASKWLDSKHENRPIFLILDILIASNLGDHHRAKLKTTILYNSMPRNVITNMLNLIMMSNETDIKTFSAKAINYLKHHTIDLNSVYYGSTFIRENFILLRFITGTLYPFVKQLEEQLMKETEEPSGIIEALAQSNIYLKRFEEAYVLFNQLVDQYKHQDSRTLFLAGIAAIGSKHTANAVALFELAKLEDPNNYESRYALGLLYLEQENIKAAAIQFGKIPDGIFQSKFFDFDIVKKELRARN